MNAAAVATTEPASPRAVLALVLGIVGLAVCILISPVAWMVGHWELADIRHGHAAREGEGMARAGLILGIIGSVPLILIGVILLLCVPVVFFALFLS